MAKNLNQNQISWKGQFIQSISHMAPAAGIILCVPYMSSRAGSALPLAMLIATILAVLLAYCLGQLTRKFYGASGYFQIHSKAIGSKYGFITSWMFFLYEPVNAFAVFFGFSVLVLEPFSESVLGFKIPWYITIFLGNTIITFLSLRSIKSSIRTSTFLCLTEVAIFLILGIALILNNPSPNINLFSVTSSSDGIGGLLFACIFGFLAFIGFESGLPLTEETKDPLQATTKGVILSVILLGIFFIFIAYAAVVGLGSISSAEFSEKFSTMKNPFGYLATISFGKIGNILVFLAILNSTFACGLASQNAIARVFFSLSRSKLITPKLSVIDEETGSPKNSIYLSFFITMLLIPITYLISQNTNLESWYGFFGLLITLPILLIHTVTCLAVYIVYKFKVKEEYTFLKHLFIPGITLFLACFPIVGSIYYNSEYPLNLVPYINLFWFLIGIFVYKRIKKTREQKLIVFENQL